MMDILSALSEVDLESLGIGGPKHTQTLQVASHRLVLCLSKVLNHTSEAGCAAELRSPCFRER